MCRLAETVARPAAIRPLRPTLNATLDALLRELAEEGIEDALRQKYTLAYIWADLCALSGEPVPRDVAAIVAEPIAVAR